MSRSIASSTSSEVSIGCGPGGPGRSASDRGRASVSGVSGVNVDGGEAQEVSQVEPVYYR